MHSSNPPNKSVLHRAARLVPVSSPPVDDGAVLVSGGTIAAAGPYASLREGCPAGTEIVDHGDAALIPALVNAHTHLELSGLAGKIDLPRNSFPDWLSKLLPHRASLTPGTRCAAIREGSE
ncbi:MAG: imidazolonepropionase-like domain-containing protein, partial [Acidobacteriota bacterium]